MNNSETSQTSFFRDFYKKLIDAIINWFITDKNIKTLESQKKILLIDDKVDLVNLMKFRLAEEGYHIETAANGLEGLELLKKYSPDLIVLDINMPKMGGVEFYSKISTGYGRPKYPVLMLTDRTQLKETFQDIEVDGFMPKPFEIEDLKREVKRILTTSINPSVVIVDSEENPHIQEIQKKLEAVRYEVAIAKDFDQLKEITPVRRPCCIFVEYMQKNITGEDFIKRAKAEDRLKEIPLVAYSFSGFDSCRLKSLNAGADNYMEAPQDHENFVKAVRSFELDEKKNWSQG